jgi:Family of unknown function (DUF6492)
MYKNNAYNETTDFVIPLHRYHYMVRTVVEAIHTFYSPRVIYIVTPKRFIPTINNVSKDWIVKKIVVIPEETFFLYKYNMIYDDIKNLFNNSPNENSREFGWWYQQLIKLGAYKQIANLSDPYVVWDSDLIPLIKWNIYPQYDGEPFKNAILQKEARSQWNTDQYRNSLFDLTRLPMNDPNEGTFVTHHFVFYHDVLESLIHHIELISNKSWIHTIMDLSHKYFRFSEYRTVAAFMNYKFPYLLKYHNFNEIGKYGIRIREPTKFINELREFFGELYEIKYTDFITFVNNNYQYLPTYLQIEHI